METFRDVRIQPLSPTEAEKIQSQVKAQEWPSSEPRSRVLKSIAGCHSEGRCPLSARGIYLSGNELRSESRFLASLGMTMAKLFQQPARRTCPKRDPHFHDL